MQAQISITVGIASEAEMKEIYSVAKKCLNDGIKMATEEKRFVVETANRCGRLRVS